ncbi:MAG: phosphatase PAP2 family protein [Lachnospiraceae bacterium]|nr:phosphatase PAP2 family protein [Lachnospiraceae bacterium]
MSFLYFLEGIRTPAGEVICQIITYFGQEILCLMLVCFMFWCMDKKTGYRMAFSFFLSSTVAQTLKLIFRIDRPWVIDPNFKPVDSALEAATGYSFPSGHTQTATSVYGIMTVESRKWWAKILWTLLFLAVGFSRMYLGVHQPKDVAVGLLVSLICIGGVYALKPEEHKNWDPAVSVFLCILAFASLAYDLYLFGNGVIDGAMAADTAKNSGGLAGFALAYYLERRYVDYQTEGTVKQKALRLILGLVSLGILYVGLKMGFKALHFGMPGDFFRYFVLMLWAMLLYPVLFTKFKL